MGRRGPKPDLTPSQKAWLMTADGASLEDVVATLPGQVPGWGRRYDAATGYSVRAMTTKDAARFVDTVEQRVRVAILHAERSLWRMSATEWSKRSARVVGSVVARDLARGWRRA